MASALGLEASSGYFRYRCRNFYTHNCDNWVWVRNTACAECVVSVPPSLSPAAGKREWRALPMLTALFLFAGNNRLQAEKSKAAMGRRRPPTLPRPGRRPADNVRCRSTWSANTAAMSPMAMAVMAALPSAAASARLSGVCCRRRRRCPRGLSWCMRELAAAPGRIRSHFLYHRHDTSLVAASSSP